MAGLSDLPFSFAENSLVVLKGVQHCSNRVV